MTPGEVENLSALGEATEGALMDPSAAGGLFVRLLVRAVSELKCEEDVERMVLDISSSQRFKQIVRSRRGDPSQP